MTKAKWVCRYIFLALLLAGCVFWCIYCAVSISKMEATVNSMEFVDMSLEQSTQALKLLDRIDKFENLLRSCLIVTAAIGVCLAAMIIFHVVSVKSAGKKKAKPQTATEITAPKIVSEVVSVSVEPAKQGGFCTNCGAHYEELPPFCIHCGTKLK